MPQSLDYAAPRSAAPRHNHLRLWGTFGLVGLVSIPHTTLAASVWFREQERFTPGGLVVTAVCFLLSAGVFAFAHTLVPRWFSAPLAAAAFALFGPGVGVAACAAVVAYLT
jgi:4-amino-4-deoxy-L-arabinose transferase-like glycosyltransferase